jgi:hypothetical protein
MSRELTTQTHHIIATPHPAHTPHPAITHQPNNKATTFVEISWISLHLYPGCSQEGSLRRNAFLLLLSLSLSSLSLSLSPSSLPSFSLCFRFFSFHLLLHFYCFLPIFFSFVKFFGRMCEPESDSEERWKWEIEALRGYEEEEKEMRKHSSSMRLSSEQCGTKRRKMRSSPL